MQVTNAELLFTVCVIVSILSLLLVCMLLYLLFEGASDGTLLLFYLTIGTIFVEIVLQIETFLRLFRDL
jgi:hypothetical protein